jgi:GH25 family lysozyme M1 (1,4-beta-N-acetylmuramidase)
MLNGIDVSQFQGTIDWKKLKADGVFVMIRANEGTPNSSHVLNIDTNFVTNLTQARELGIPHGIYHFSYPQYNTAVAEANFFCDLIQKNGGLQKDEILALDYEEVKNVSWAAVWLQTVEGIFGGYKPLIYMDLNFDQSENWLEVIKGGFGLWLAEYNGSKSFVVAPQWPVVAIRQWTDAEKIAGINGLVDGDVFNGNIDVFDKYGYQPPVIHKEVTTTVTQDPTVSETTSVPSSTSSSTADTSPTVSASTAQSDTSSATTQVSSTKSNTTTADTTNTSTAESTPQKTNNTYSYNNHIPLQPNWMLSWWSGLISLLKRIFNL